MVYYTRDGNYNASWRADKTSKKTYFLVSEGKNNQLVGHILDGEYFLVLGDDWLHIFDELKVPEDICDILSTYKQDFSGLESGMM